ncbi:endoglucanase 19-like isoform X2 [Apium graveolens]|uniref:endoglucanase 19-like isoform X2 n=1 Tax=Apium graveolens TaxID=4045 RepID=UPI003D7B5106
MEAAGLPQYGQLGHGTEMRYPGWRKLEIVLGGMNVHIDPVGGVSVLMGGKGGHHASVFGKYQEKAEFFMCSCLGKGSRNVQKTPGGLIF